MLRIDNAKFGKVKNGKAVVVVTAAWCKSCPGVKQAVDTAARAFGIESYEMDSEHFDEQGHGIAIRSVPTILLCNKGDISSVNGGVSSGIRGRIKELSEN